VRKSSANEEISKLRPAELSLTTPGSIIAGLNAVITSRARARASDRAISRVLDEQRKYVITYLGKSDDTCSGEIAFASMRA